MRETPAPFSVPMVRAIATYRKRITRRVAKMNHACRVSRGGKNWHPDDPDAINASPYGFPGDRIWIREPWITSASFDLDRPSALSKSSAIHYLSDGAPPAWFSCGRYRHARFMPRWASRFTLEVTAVRLERLHKITEQDALWEGVGLLLADDMGSQCEAMTRAIEISRVAGFRLLWTTINGEDSWADNPYVWVTGFKIVSMSRETSE